MRRALVLAAVLLLAVAAVVLLAVVARLGWRRWQTRASAHPALEQAIADGDWAKTIDLAEAWHAREPEAVAPVWVVILADNRLGRYNEGERVYFRLDREAQIHVPQPKLANWARGLAERHRDSALAWEMASQLAHRAGRHRWATDFAAKAVALAPDDPASWYARGDAYFASGRNREAITAFSRELRLLRARPSTRPQKASDEKARAAVSRVMAWALHDRAFAYASENDFAHALADANEAAKLAPRMASVYYCRGRIYQDERAPARAVADYGKCLALVPEFEAAHNVRGIAYYAMGKYPLALRDYTRALEQIPCDVAAVLNRAGLYDQLGEKAQATAAANRAVRLLAHPQTAQAYRRRGDAQALLGHDRKALSDYSHAVRLDPKDAWAWAGMGDEDLRRGRSADAIRPLTRAVNLCPNCAHYHLLRARAYRYTGRYTDALQDLRQVLKLDPRDAWAYADRGRLDLDVGEWHQALDDVDKALAVDRGDPDLEYWCASMLCLRGRYEQAAQVCGKAIAVAPKIRYSWYWRGRAYEGLGKYKLARKDFTRDIELDPDDVGGYAERSRVEQETGKVDAAQDDANQAVKLDEKRLRGHDLYAALYAAAALSQASRGEVRNAEDDMGEVFRITKKNPDAYAARADLREMLGDADGCNDDAEEVVLSISNYTQDPRELAMLGRAYGQTGRYAKALEYLKKATRHGPWLADAYAYLSHAYCHEDDYGVDAKYVNLAVAAGKKAAKLAPESFDAHAYLAEALLYQGHFQAAAKECLVAITVAPASPVGYGLLGMAEEMLGQASVAENWYRKADGLCPGYRDTLQPYLEDLKSAYPDKGKSGTGSG